METLYYKFRQAIGDLIYEATDESNHDLDVSKFITTTVEILAHGFKTNGTMFKKGRSLWDFITYQYNDRVIIETVLNLTEQDPTLRVDMLLKMALLQQTLTNLFEQLYSSEEVLLEWYLDTALMRNLDMRNSVIEITKSLQKIDFDIDIQQVEKRDLIPQLNFLGNMLSPSTLKSGLNQTITTIGNVPGQIATTAKSGIDLIKGNTDYIDKAEYDKLQHQLTLETAEKIKAKLMRDRIKRQFGEEIVRLESILKYHNIEFDSVLNTLMNE